SLQANAGVDENRSASDDGFVRRFVARQMAFNCPAVNDCTGASFVAEALVQWRHNLHASESDRNIPGSATRLRLIWSQQPTVFRDVAVTQHSANSFPFGYGFVPSLAVVNPPANGQFYQTGESVTFRVTFRDGDGNR